MPDKSVQSPLVALRQTLQRLAVPLSLRITLGAFVVSTLIGIGLVGLLGFPMGRALQTSVQGAFGDVSAIADTLVFMTPRLLVALGALIAIRGGMFNLGGEGQLQFGAIGAMIPFLALGDQGWVLIPLCIVSGAICGALWGLIPAILKITRGSDEIIVTLLMNFIAIYFLKFLVQGPLQPEGSNFNMSAKLPDRALLPTLIDGTRLHAGVLLAIVAAILTWVLIHHTAFGLRLRAAGASPRFFRLQGAKPGAMTIKVMLVSGGFGGLAGAVEVMGVQYRLIDGFSTGIGFEGLAVAFLGGLEAFGALFVALYFGAVNSATLALQAKLSVPSSLAEIMTGLPILILAVAYGLLALKGKPVWTLTR